MRLAPLLRASWLANLFVYAIALAPRASAADLPGTLALAVSPGAVRASPPVGSSCPTFSWALADDAEGYELVVLDLADPERPQPVVEKSFGKGTSGWTPSGGECLAAGGTYAWTVRPLTGEAVWSTPLRFRVPGAPSAEELAAALAVLERWRAAGEPGGTGGDGGRGEESAPGRTSRNAARRVRRSPRGFGHLRYPRRESGQQRRRLRRHRRQQLRGRRRPRRPQRRRPDPTSILDGVANGQADTLLSQSGIDRPSASAQTFDIENSGGGGMALRVQGAAVSLVGHSPRRGRDQLGHRRRRGDRRDLDARRRGDADRPRQRRPRLRPRRRLSRRCRLGELPGPGHRHLPGRTVAARHQRRRQRGLLRSSARHRSSASSTIPRPARWVHSPRSPSAPTASRSSATCDDTVGDLKVAKCNDAACAPGATRPSPRSTAPVNDVGYYTSLAIGADGFPVISYFDISATATSRSPSATTQPAPEATRPSPRSTPQPTSSAPGTSIAIGADGFPVISYQDDTACDLKVVKCDDAACAPGGETFTTVDERRSTMSATTPPSPSAPTASRSSATSTTRRSTLKVAKCDDAACAPVAP